MCLIAFPLIALVNIIAWPLCYIFTRDEEVIQYAIEMLRVQTFVVFVETQRQACMMWLIRIRQPKIAFYSNILYLLVQVPIMYVMVEVYELGIPGYAYSTLIATSLVWVLIIL